jgi:hypothetical protein
MATTSCGVMADGDEDGTSHDALLLALSSGQAQHTADLKRLHELLLTVSRRVAVLEAADATPAATKRRGGTQSPPAVAMEHQPGSQSHDGAVYMPSSLVEAPPLTAEARGVDRPAPGPRQKRARRANNTESSGLRSRSRSSSRFSSSSNSGSGTETTSAPTSAGAAGPSVQRPLLLCSSASGSTTPESDGQQQGLDWSVARQLLIESEPRYGPRPRHVRRSAECQLFAERPRARRLPVGSDRWRNSGGEH